MSRRVAIAGVCVSLLSLQLATAQYGGEGSGNAAYDARFVFARIRYGGWSSSWNHDYPRADRHLQHILDDLTLIPTNLETSNVLDLDQPEIFLHPMIYLSEPGFWTMTAAEGENLRQYLLKGGFIMLGVNYVIYSLTH
jgi:hypothetical protein